MIDFYREKKYMSQKLLLQYKQILSGEVLKDLVTQRGSEMDAGNTIEASEAAAAHQKEATKMFTHRKVKDTKAPKRRNKYRTKSQKTGIGLHSNGCFLGLGGFALFEVDAEELEKGEHPEDWRSGSCVSGKGPVCATTPCT